MGGLNLSLKKGNTHLTTFKVGQVEIGKDFVVIAGPCSVESEEQIITIAKSVKASGANMLRGGAFKPRTSPYSFQGLGEKALIYLKRASEITGLPVVTEVMDTTDIELVSEYADVLQIGARNVQNYSLLKAVGKTDKPILLKRGFSTTLEEYLFCAEYVLNEGNSQVILCERGIRSGTSKNNVFDINIIPTLKRITHLPVIADPSHGTNNRDIIIPVSLSAIIAGADGLMVEVHSNIGTALSDVKQQLNLDEFSNLSKMIYQTFQFRNCLK